MLIQLLLTTYVFERQTRILKTAENFCPIGPYYYCFQTITKSDTMLQKSLKYLWKCYFSTFETEHWISNFSFK